MSDGSGRPRRERAVATLAAAGIDPDAAARGEFPDPETLDAALLEALGEIGGEGTASRLAAVVEATADHSRSKALRRALHRLRERGIVVPTMPPPGSFRMAPGPDIEGFVTAIDGRGDRAMWFLRPKPTEGTLLISVHVNEPRGVTAVRIAGDVTRKQIRQTRHALAHEGGWALVPADWRLLDALCVEAHERRASPTPDTDYLRVRSRLTEAPPLPPRELASARVSVPTAEETRELLAASDKLLGEPEFRAWQPEPGALAPFAAEVESVRESPLVLSPLQQQERLRSVLARATAALYPPAAAARWLQGTAYVLAETGRPAAAAMALAISEATATRPDASAEIPFFAALVQRNLAALLRPETRDGALVLTPGELRAQSSSRPSRIRE